MTSLLRPNDVICVKMTSFWRYNDVVIRLCVQWIMTTTKSVPVNIMRNNPPPLLTKSAVRLTWIKELNFHCFHLACRDYSVSLRIHGMCAFTCVMFVSFASIMSAYVTIRIAYEHMQWECAHSHRLPYERILYGPCAHLHMLSARLLRPLHISLSDSECKILTRVDVCLSCRVLSVKQLETI